MNSERTYEPIELKDFILDFEDKHIVKGLPKLCWKCIKQHKEGFMVYVKNHLRRVFLCAKCLKILEKEGNE